MTVGGLILVRNDRVVSDLIALSYEPSCVCVSSDDGIVYVGGKDCSIHIYSVSNDNDDNDGNGNGYTLDEIHTLSGTHLQPIYALSISNDGTKLASADVRDICIWNIDEEYSTKIGKGRWCFHNQRINAITWSNDDTILASGGNDDSIFLWSMKKPLRRVHYSFAHCGGITAMEFLKNADGMILASVGNDGCVNQWDVTDDIIKKFG
jgi:WD40 repeat protein